GELALALGALVGFHMVHPFGSCVGGDSSPEGIWCANPLGWREKPEKLNWRGVYRFANFIWKRANRWRDVNIPIARAFLILEESLRVAVNLAARCEGQISRGRQKRTTKDTKGAQRSATS